MKQRLLLVLLALFTSIGWMNADVTLTIPKGATGSLSFTAVTGNDATPVSIEGVGTIPSPYKIDDLVKDAQKDIKLQGSLKTLNVNTKVTGNVILTDAFQLTSLVFSSTAGSTITNITFTGTNG